MRRYEMGTRADHPGNCLSADVELTGQLRFAGQLTFDGAFDGHITGDGTLILGDHAIIRGSIRAGRVVVRGKVNATITAKDMIEIKSNAQLVGDITTRAVTIEEGAIFIGQTRLAADGVTATEPNISRGGLRLGGR